MSHQRSSQAERHGWIKEVQAKVNLALAETEPRERGVAAVLFLREASEELLQLDSFTEPAARVAILIASAALLIAADYLPELTDET